MKGNEEDRKLVIKPDTKIGALLDTFPELEGLLAEMAPAFSKLQNPILRKTIAKIATLRQAAEIGNIPLGEMINRLRCAVGQETEENISFSGEKPDWISGKQVIETLDARPMLAKGEHPVQLVMSRIANLQVGEVYRLITPFKPVPLIETAEKKGFLTWTEKISGQEFYTYFSSSNNLT
jgi:uncharacterized protein (DUF2249 family)